MSAAAANRTARSASRRWARVPLGARTMIRIYADDAAVLRALVPSWPDVGPCPGLTLRRLLAASKGTLWRMKDGKPVPTPSFYFAN